MEMQRWSRIGEIYHSALLVPRPERPAFVVQACEGDDSMQREVNSLLDADESSGAFLETAVFEVGLRVLMDSEPQTMETVLAAGEETAHPLVGMTLDDRYAIQEELGHGGVGAVYLARDRKLHDKPVVVKVLLEKSLQNEWVVLKFQQEKEALSRVDHPGVVGILDNGEMPDGKPYLVMQFIDGESLRSLIKSKPEGMDFQRTAALVKQMGSALNAVHDKRIFHRDLKPENIMLQALGRGEEQVKILDFGIAKVKESILAPSTVTGTGTAGTIVYMSPEQLRGEKVTASSDIYSLAVIAYEMLTGRRPFSPDTIAHLAEMQREGVRAKPADLRPRLSGEAEAILLRGLSFNAKDRYQSAAEFGDDLSRALLNEEETLRHVQPAEIPPTEISPYDSPTSRQQKTMVTPFDNRGQKDEQKVEAKTHKRRWPMAAAALVVLALIAAGAYVLINRQTLFGNLSKAAPPATAAERSLTYSLTVQKMREGRPYQEPFESSGQEIFENGYKFRLNFSSPQSGYLYMFNEGAGDNGGLIFNIIYPTPATNKGSAKLDASQSIQTNWNTFGGKAGTEEFWIVWSASPVGQLESARDAAFKTEGTLTDASMVRTVKEFLTSHSEPKPETTKNTMKQQTDVRARTETLVKLVQLEHR